MSFYKNSHFTSSYPDKFESFGKFRVLWLYRTKEARTVFASSSHGLSLKLFALRRYVTLHYVTLRYICMRDHRLQEPRIIYDRT